MEEVRIQEGANIDVYVVNVVSLLILARCVKHIVPLFFRSLVGRGPST